MQCVYYDMGIIPIVFFIIETDNTAHLLVVLQ